MRRFLAAFSLLVLPVCGGGELGSGDPASQGSVDAPGDCACDYEAQCNPTCICDPDCESPQSPDGEPIDLGGGDSDSDADGDPIDIPGSSDDEPGQGAGCSGNCNTDLDCDARCGGNGVCLSIDGVRSCEPAPDDPEGNDQQPIPGGNDVGGGGSGSGGGECLHECQSNADCCSGWSCQAAFGFGVCAPM